MSSKNTTKKPIKSLFERKIFKSDKQNLVEVTSNSLFKKEEEREIKESKFKEYSTPKSIRKNINQEAVLLPNMFDPKCFLEILYMLNEKAIVDHKRDKTNESNETDLSVENEEEISKNLKQAINTLNKKSHSNHTGKVKSIFSLDINKINNAGVKVIFVIY